jgi:hypothetical protein
MASLAFSLSIGRSISPSNAMVSDKFKSRREGFSLGKGTFARKRDPRDSMVPKVATQAPTVFPSLEKELAGDRNHVAWTSVQQERYEGELDVQGEIPLWLVCKILHLIFHALVEINYLICTPPYELRDIRYSCVVRVFIQKIIK